MGIRLRDPAWVVDPATGCWKWSNRIDRKGYGHHGTKLAHRWSYEFHVGPIAEGMTIDHLCFNPPCVNPAHLRPMTLSENARRQRSASKTHCVNGHEFTPENTYIRWFVSHGMRQCRACQRATAARYRARKAAAR